MEGSTRLWRLASLQTAELSNRDNTGIGAARYQIIKKRSPPCSDFIAYYKISQFEPYWDFWLQKNLPPTLFLPTYSGQATPVSRHSNTKQEHVRNRHFSAEFVLWLTVHFTYNMKCNPAEYGSAESRFSGRPGGRLAMWQEGTPALRNGKT
jgi:hypothetical protein